MMLTMVRPKYFIPVHGEYRHLVQHARLARNSAYQENVFIPENGDVIEFTRDSGGSPARFRLAASSGRARYWVMWVT